MILYHCPREECGWTPVTPTDITQFGQAEHRWLCGNCGQIIVHLAETDWPFAQRDTAPDPRAVFDALALGARHGIRIPRSL